MIDKKATKSDGESDSELEHPSATVMPSHEQGLDPSDPTDSRAMYQWSTRYPPEANKEIILEGIYLSAVLIVSLLTIFANWNGSICVMMKMTIQQGVIFKKYMFFASSGLLGGITFGIKYFYRVVARGYWHQDRRTWRVMSPVLAMVTAIVVGAMIDSNFINPQKPISTPSIVFFGFLAGYFADEAVSKMAEIAGVIFGSSTAKKAPDGKK
jgi:hypothetical protein